MEGRIFSACVERLHKLQVIYITFNTGPGGIAGLRRLLSLAGSISSVRINEGNTADLQAVCQSGTWEQVSRTVRVYGLMCVPADLLEPMARDIQAIHAGDHFAKALFTNNLAKQRQAVTDIIREVLNQEILDLADDYGARINAQLIFIDGLPAVSFEFFNVETNERLTELVIDGFSGRPAIDREWGDHRFSNVQQVRERIYSVLTDCLDRMTAPA